jgi:hypothetical protein
VLQIPYEKTRVVGKNRTWLGANGTESGRVGKHFYLGDPGLICHNFNCLWGLLCFEVQDGRFALGRRLS